MDTIDTKQKYVNFYTNFAFKKLFGTEENKDLLIEFLNAMFDGSEMITDLKYLNCEQLGASALERKAIFDVYCRNEQGDRFIIEMQKAEQNFFKDRSIYYSTFPIQEQAVKGEWNFHLDKVYTIGILDFVFDDTDPDYYHYHVQLMDTVKKTVFYDKLTYYFIEMPKFRKTESQLVTLFDKWLYAMKHMGTLSQRPSALQEPVFTRLFDQAEIAKLTPTEQRNYRESQKNYWDFFSVTQTAENKGRVEGIQVGRAEGLEQGLKQGRAEGLEQGLEQGLKQGRAEGIMEIAKRLKAMGTDISTITQITGLIPNELADL